MRHYLLVDDNRAFADNIAEIIRDLGQEVSIATNGQDALGLVRERKFDAMLTDMRMPVMSGAQLIHEVRALDPGLPAVLATAFSGDEDLRIARDEGLLCVMQKPVPVEGLLRLLQNARRDGMVVLVEDDALLADNLTEALRDVGFTAVSASSVGETERLGAVRPFVAIVDLRVPGGPDGEAMRRVSEKFNGLPQLVVTAHDVAAMPVPAHTVFRKPFRTPELMETVERLYRERRVSA